MSIGLISGIHKHYIRILRVIFPHHGRLNKHPIDLGRLISVITLILKNISKFEILIFRPQVIKGVDKCLNVIFALRQVFVKLATNNLHHVIDIAILGIDTILFIDEMLNHSRLDTTRNIKSDVLNYLVVGYKVSVFNFQMVRVMHKHPLASDILIFLRVPTESYLNRTVNQIISFNSDALVQLPLIKTTFMTA